MKKIKNLSRLLALMLILVTSINTVWADSSVKGASVKYNNGSDHWWDVSSTPLDLGVVSTFKLKGFWAQVGTENVCQNTCMYYGLTSGAEDLGNYNIQDPNDWSPSTKHFQTEAMDVDILSGRVPGSYTLYVKFVAHGQKSGSSCGQINSSTYQIKFKYYPDLYVPGNNWGLGNWAFDNTSKMDKNTTTGVYTKTVAGVTAANHKFKVATYNYGMQWSFSAYNSSASSNVYSASDNSGDFQFQPAMAGSVTITYTSSTQKISITCAAPTITLDDEGGSGGSGTQNTYYNVATSSVSVPSKTGYIFGGYYDGDNGTGNQIINATGVWQKNKTNFTDNSSTPKWIVRADYTLHAKWTAKQCTVNLNNHDATTSGATSVTATYDAEMPSIASNLPAKNGYDFDGYYASAGGSGTKYYKANGSSNHVWDVNTTSAQTLHANWTLVTYDITYNQNGGSGATNTTYNIEDDDITLPDGNDMSKDGYNFAGWHDNEDLEGDAITTIPSGSYGDKEFWAKWVDATTYYSVTTGVVGHGSISADPDDASLVAGTDIEFTATPDDYYEVEAWYTDAACTEGRHSAGATTYNVVGLDDDITVYVKFQPISYTITYNLNGGTNHGDNPENYTYESSAISLQDPSKTGYTFVGWYTESTFVNKVTSIAAGSNGNKAFWAKWTANPYTITLNNHDATTAGSTSISVTYDATTNLTETPAITVPQKDGYTFGGYYTGENGTGTQIIAANGNVNANAGSGTYTSATKQWKYAGDITLHAKWTARPYKIVYFAKPADWTHVYAYVWKESGTANASWPGKQLDGSVAGTGTEIINCATYYYYKYYTDGGSADGEGLVGNSAWNKVIFNNGDNPGVANNTKTSNLNLVSGNAYGIHTSMQSTSANGYATSTKWTLRGSFNSWSSSTYPFSCAEGEHSYSVLVEGLTASTNYSFKIWGPDGVAYKYTGGKDASYDADYSVTSLLDGRDLVLNEYASNNNTFTTATTSYIFTLDVTDPKHPVLTIVPGDDADYSVTLAVSGHGKITTPGTGSKTIHKYAPTTITAVADPGYRFTGWTVDGDHSSYVTFGNASSLSTNVTGVAGANGATITANFSNDGFVYFDASAVSGFSGGGKVYVTYLKSNALSWDGTTGALIVKNWISDALHNQEMTRIPNTNIYYFYTATAPQGKILFTSKSHAGSDYKLWEMAAVVREDFNVGQDNMFVAENWVLKDKNKTGYYDGYWMKYNETDPGVQLCIYSMASGTPHISGSPFSFTRTEEGSRIYTTKVTGLTANTQYGIEIKGLNGTYYKNRGEMTSTNAVGGWDYVDREATRGTIRTTAAGDYDVKLSCSDKLILAVDFPLAVGDYQVKYSGKDSVGGNTITNASSVIRHIGAVGSKNDTVSFFVVKGDSWTLQLQKCTAVSPSITWANVGPAKAAASFGSPETGVYNFVVKQDSASGTPVTPSFATMTPIAYTGNYYIRTDAAAGGWEAYKKSMDNRMVFSNYSKQHSNYDHYHCHYSKSGKNVKFCIANDYSGQLSVVMTTDSYVNSYGNLYADANVRFMWNSETNVVRRAYLNGSSTTDFLVLAAKNDSVKNANGTAISKSGDYNQVKFEDKNNWVYQKEVQALEGTHYRLTSNYRYSGDDHIQYFKGSYGDWTPAHTELLIGGTTSSWQTLRLIYDFKTNHLTAAWLPPTTDITTAKQIEADMLLIRTSQNAAQQLTFTGSGSVADVKTIIGAIELRYDSIVGRVGNFNGDAIGGNRANRELMYYISFPFDVAVSDIYGFGQLNKEWYLQYYDGAERASKGWFKGDGTTTFWKFMTLSDTLKANVGYSLLLDNDYFNAAGTGTVWEHMKSGDKIYLYFPSAKELDGSMVIKTGSAALPVPSHECTIDRTFVSENSGRTVNHKFTDSHWNMMGVPLFQNQTSVGTDKFIAAISTEDPQELVPFPAHTGYFYEWDSLRNTLSVRTTSGYTFKSMHGYMVQFTGTVGFSGSSIQPASPVAARRTKLNRDNYTIELQLLQNNNRVSRTYVELREEACDTFALNEDVYMMYSALPANLYTFAGNYDVSANVLSVNDHTIPVGITVRNAGTYTFTMPSDFNGSVTLIDNVENTRTNLALSDYEVTLPKGVCEGRFSVEIGIHKVPTSIDVIEDGGSLKDGKAHKFIMNDQMYIIKNGVIYDARGARVK